MEEEIEHSDINYLSDMPIELLLAICLYLDYLSLKTLMLVSKSLNTIAIDSYVWKFKLEHDLGFNAEKNVISENQSYFSLYQDRRLLKHLLGFNYSLFLSMNGDKFEIEYDHNKSNSDKADIFKPAAQRWKSHDDVIKFLQSVKRTPETLSHLKFFHFNNNQYKDHWQNGTINYHEDDIDKMLKFVENQKKKTSTTRCLIA